jgi:hypothetical protein
MIQEQPASRKQLKITIPNYLRLGSLLCFQS